MYLILIFLPLLSAFTAGMFGRKIGSYGASILTVTCLIITFFLSIFCFYEVGLVGSVVYIKLITWIDSELLNVDWGFLFDSLTVIMCCVVTFISFLVHLYSTEYMSHDPHLPRFLSYLSLFTFFMLILITADNYVQMFVGWEGVGLCSYLLINFWFTRIQANKAAIKAMIVNRIGDFGLSLGILTIFINFKAVDYATVFSLTPFYVEEKFFFFNFEFDLLSIISFFLFIGAVGKSAQLGLHTWLPDAMEGPTPVSALIHAATMVTAGVFLIARSSIIFEYAPMVLIIVSVIGASTAFFAATTGLLQNDLKRVIAYSTCSQLGYMIFACGLSNYSVGIFHLANHAFFKALLFLAAGSIIHAVADEQDMRKMGGLKNIIPYTYSIMLIGSLALMGFPFLTGFYSKDVILEIAYGKFSNIGHFSYVLGTCGAFLTAFYSTRLLYLTFLSKPNAYKSVIFSAQEPSYQINTVLALLAIPSIFIGFYLKDMCIGLGTDFWGNSIFVLPENMNRIDAEFINQFFKLLPVIVTCLGSFFAFLSYTFFDNFLFKFKISIIGKKLYNFLNRKWFFDKVFNEYITQNLLKFGYRTTYKIIDRGIIEIFGPLGLSTIISKKANYLYKLQSGFLYHYTLIILISSTVFLGIRQFWLYFSDFIDYRIFILLFLFISFFVSNKNKIN
jgi:NADH-ubiquinone oxidoreductase chain 5